jgi:hypothetical protein
MQLERGVVPRHTTPHRLISGGWREKDLLLLDGLRALRIIYERWEVPRRYVLISAFIFKFCPFNSSEAIADRSISLNALRTTCRPPKFHITSQQITPKAILFFETTPNNNTLFSISLVVD